MTTSTARMLGKSTWGETRKTRPEGRRSAKRAERRAFQADVRDAIQRRAGAR
jgi:hypothetical protein